MSVSTYFNPEHNLLEIQVDGRFDFSLHRAFRDAYEKVDLSKARVVIDLTRTQYLDSSALGMLLVLRERCGGDRADIVLRGAHAGIQQVLSVSRFQHLFKIE